jgi:hypothetical protein
MSTFWLLARYRAILGQNHKIVKSLKTGKKMHNYFIAISILNPDTFSCDKYHSLSFLMSQTWFVYFIDHFGAKKQNF